MYFVCTIFTTVGFGESFIRLKRWKKFGFNLFFRRHLCSQYSRAGKACMDLYNVFRFCQVVSTSWFFQLGRFEYRDWAPDANKLWITIAPYIYIFLLKSLVWSVIGCVRSTGIRAQLSCFQVYCIITMLVAAFLFGALLGQLQVLFLAG